VRLEVLSRLAESGFSAVPPYEFSGLSDELWAAGASTGDARWCWLARSVELLRQTWDERQVVPGRLADDLASTLSQWIPAVVDAPGPEEGTHLASVLFQDLALQLARGTW
jgi:hypothetical protein